MALPQRPCCQGLELTSIFGSMANGYGAVSAGVSLICLGGWASLAGVGLCAVGGLTMALGANEMVDAVINVNYIQQCTGMSDCVSF